MYINKLLLISLRILAGTLILPAGVGLVLIGAMIFNAPFSYFLGRCTNLETCFLSRLSSELQRSDFWKFIFAMWICGVFIVIIQIYRDWSAR